MRQACPGFIGRHYNVPLTYPFIERAEDLQAPPDPVVPAPSTPDIAMAASTPDNAMPVPPPPAASNTDIAVPELQWWAAPALPVQPAQPDRPAASSSASGSHMEGPIRVISGTSFQNQPNRPFWLNDFGFYLLLVRDLPYEISASELHSDLYCSFPDSSEADRICDGVVSIQMNIVEHDTNFDEWSPLLRFVRSMLQRFTDSHCVGATRFVI